MKRLAAFVVALLAAVLAGHFVARGEAQPAVSVALVLAADVSGSITRDQIMLQREAARGLLVCKLTGWKDSYGVSVEIRAFRKAGKPVIYMEPGAVPPGLA